MPKLICNIIGEKYYVTQDHLDKRIKKSGLSKEEFFETYICKKAKDLLQRGYSVPEIRNLTNAKDDLPEISDKTLEKISANIQTSNISRILSNFESVSSLTDNHTDEEVKKLIENLKNEEKDL